MGDEVQAVQRVEDVAEGTDADDEDSGAEADRLQAGQGTHAAARAALARLGKVFALQGVEQVAGADQFAGQVGADQVAQGGDVARLEVEGVVVDDRFCDGSPWTIAIDRWRRADGAWPSITLAVLPIAADLPVFLEPEARSLGAGAALRRATLGVERRLVIDLGVGER